ncbi:Protein of unknown function (DUF740) [Abeliophyllum distichum]|uniref:Uncharacterized protein n=1 Tax=Abeliophyllum distichum TaxID=126358 RepID=A0ABD1V910_9LAMI
MFSLDAGRISFDDPRYSFDEPGAFWDGHSIGRSFLRMRSMVSVLEDASAVHVLRSNTQIAVKGQVMMTTNCASEFGGVPGGSVQTQEYYLHSSSRRTRMSLDRSSSICKTVAEMDEIKAVSNSRVSPANADYFLGAKGMGREELKTSRRLSWTIWGFIHRHSARYNNEEEDEERYNGVNRVDRLFSESWHELRREGNDDTGGESTTKVLRSNSSVSWRNSNRIGNSFGGVKKSDVMNGHRKKRRDEFALERNQSARYSPNHIDNGFCTST